MYEMDIAHGNRRTETKLNATLLNSSHSYNHSMGRYRDKGIPVLVVVYL